VATLSEYLQRLRDKGLIILGPYNSEDLLAPNGYRIAKPKSVGGNSLRHWENWVGGEWDSVKEQMIGEVLTDAPELSLFEENGAWIVSARDLLTPGGLCTQYERKSDSIEGAVQDVLEYYFGDPKLIDKGSRWPSKPVDADHDYEWPPRD